MKVNLEQKRKDYLARRKEAILNRVQRIERRSMGNSMEQSLDRQNIDILNNRIKRILDCYTFKQKGQSPNLSKSQLVHVFLEPSINKVIIY